MYKDKNKKKGYFILENIVALSLIGIISSLVVSVFSTSVFNLKKNQQTNQMINLAKNEMSNIEYKMQNNNEENLYENASKTIDEYSINSKIIKNQDYYECYKVSVSVKYYEKEIIIDSYVVRN
ncbi:type II secretion system protein [Paraclostridium ghonii]|uniref:type II secretion system protein n=1 Tax=Paraclostridium ghonii TaxID=29358 RepID=UPI00202CB467|nr:type II secretion system protein [Paeniclostridium ghonii]MCM0165193.1 type II secretion system GspH family protein [Paeniclostridium ghonii]